MKRLDVIGARVGRIGQRNEGGEEPLRLNAGIDTAQAREALQQQTGAGEQEQRERNFRDHEQTAQSMTQAAAGGSAAPAFVQRGLQIEPRSLKRWRETKEDAGDERDQNREAEHHAVELDVGDARDVLRHQPDEHFGSPRREDQSEQSAEPRKHDALRQQLPDDAAASCTERRTQRDLLCANRGAREQQVRDVRDRDQQHAADRTEEHIERARDIADEIFAQRANRGAEIGIRIRILLLERRGERGQFRLRLLDADTRVSNARQPHSCDCHAVRWQAVRRRAETASIAIVV